MRRYEIRKNGVYEIYEDSEGRFGNSSFLSDYERKLTGKEIKLLGFDKLIINK